MAEKDVQVAQNGGRGGEGGEEIWAMPERKHSFFMEVFPKQKLSINIQNLLVSTSFRSSDDNNSCSSKMALLLLKFNILLWVFVPSIAPREVIISVIINIIVIIVIINIIASREFLNTAIYHNYN